LSSSRRCDSASWPCSVLRSCNRGFACRSLARGSRSWLDGGTRCRQPPPSACVPTRAVLSADFGIGLARGIAAGFASSGTGVAPACNASCCLQSRRIRLVQSHEARSRAALGMLRRNGRQRIAPLDHIAVCRCGRCGHRRGCGWRRRSRSTTGAPRSPRVRRADTARASLRSRLRRYGRAGLALSPYRRADQQ
jgi:hypothetical protein